MSKLLVSQHSLHMENFRNEGFKIFIPLLVTFLGQPKLCVAIARVHARLLFQISTNVFLQQKTK